MTLPATAAPPAPVTATLNVPGAAIATGSIALLKVAFIAALTSTFVFAFAGLVKVIVGAVVSGPAPVVKLHGFGNVPATKALPVRSSPRASG